MALSSASIYGSANLSSASTYGSANLSSTSIYGSVKVDYWWALNGITVTRCCHYLHFLTVYL